MPGYLTLTRGVFVRLHFIVSYLYKLAAYVFLQLEFLIQKNPTMAPSFVRQITQKREAPGRSHFHNEIKKSSVEFIRERVKSQTLSLS